MRQSASTDWSQRSERVVVAERIRRDDGVVVVINGKIPSPSSVSKVERAFR